jgi:hypothetical protein
VYKTVHDVRSFKYLEKKYFGKLKREEVTGYLERTA